MILFIAQDNVNILVFPLKMTTTSLTIVVHSSTVQRKTTITGFVILLNIVSRYELISANTKHLYNIYTKSAQRLRRWPNIVQMIYKNVLCLLGYHSNPLTAKLFNLNFHSLEVSVSLTRSITSSDWKLFRFDKMEVNYFQILLIDVTFHFQYV